MGLIDEMRAEGHTVVSVICVLREQGVPVAAPSYGAWRQGRGSSRTVTDPQVEGAVRDVAWTTIIDAEGVERQKR